MKSTFVFLLCLVVWSANGQGVFSNYTNSALQRVIEDYPNKFQNIKGEKIGAKGTYSEYKTTIEIPGAAPGIISLQGLPEKEQYSWKTALYSSDDFNHSKEKFRELFNHIKNTIVKINGLPPFILSGNYEMPVADKKSNTVAFQLLPSSGQWQQLKVELVLQQQGQEWKILLKVFDKDAVDNSSLATMGR